MKKTLKISLIALMVIGVGIGVGFGLTKNTEKVLGESDVQNMQPTAIIGSRNATTGATTTATLSGSFASTTAEFATPDIGQLDIACHYTPWEDSVKLYWQLLNGTKSRAATNCSDTEVDWYLPLIQTNQSATSTYDRQLHVIEE